MFHAFRNCIPFQSIFSSCIVQPEYVIQHIKASLRCWHQMEHLAELESVLFTSELEITGDENEHAPSGTRGLAIDSGDGVLALLEGKASELSDDVLRALDFLAFKSQHRTFLIEIGEPRAIGIKRRVVVLDEGFSH